VATQKYGAAEALVAVLAHQTLVKEPGTLRVAI